MKKKILRQGLNVSLNQLRLLQRDLIKQREELNKEMGISKDYIDWESKFQINIINKQPECSDTWTIE